MAWPPQAICPDCRAVVTLGTVFLTADGRLVYFARCPTCHLRGDVRSVRFFVEIPLETAQRLADEGALLVANIGHVEDDDGKEG